MGRAADGTFEPVCSAVAGGFLATRSRPCRAGRHPPSLSMNLHLVTRVRRPGGARPRGPGAGLL